MRKIAHYPLWIGHAGDGRDLAGLYGVGIRAVVQLAFEEPAIQPPRDLIYVRVPISDGAGDQGDFLALAIQTTAELLSRRIPTLVCCAAGMSRSPCVAAAALARAFQLNPDDCLAIVAGQGPCDVSPSLWSKAIETLSQSGLPNRPLQVENPPHHDLDP